MVALVFVSIILMVSSAFAAQFIKQGENNTIAGLIAIPNTKREALPEDQIMMMADKMMSIDIQ